ncbi:tRNA(Met) cytidine acetate ligase [Paenibacillus flagellatus]|uniref:tRNA(Met) cytidine acetate ligase n=1 Tax=Paenibacillus flagellatus TaxID=2211139 RepID=A0A2V5KIG4_9BACL|nr:nucleotidyltransferase family protein [Paenibacillus flagellatus]PYI54240.1 nucleotidyltransferase [Paenibacillus flagellatus]
MKTVGMIVEYNPLHNGHVYHCQQSKIVSGADAVVAVMSGSFLQRGEPALVSKWARTEMALRMGADLVLELPVAFSTQPAEWFAYGAVSALESTGVVDAFCFGSESGDLGLLQSAARRLHATDRDAPYAKAGAAGDEAALASPADGAMPFREAIQAQLKAGASYPSAYAAAAAGTVLDGDAPADWLAQPNNTLGLHYLVALERLGGTMRPYTIRRQKAEYNQTDITDERIASATALRKLLADSTDPAALRPYVPSYVADVLDRELRAGRAPVGWESLFPALFARLAVVHPKELAEYGEVTEGLEHRILKAVTEVRPDEGEPFEQLLQALKTKRYTRTKLQRALTRILLNHRKDELTPDALRAGVPYLRVLGFSDRGRTLLRTMRKTASVPVVAKAAAFRHRFLDLDIRAATVHATAFRQPTRRDLYRDYYEPPIRLTETSPD